MRRRLLMRISEDRCGPVGASRAAYRYHDALARSGSRWWAILCAAALVTSAAAQEDTPRAKFYRIIDGRVDARTYNGYRRYHAVCNHCHGPDGMGSSFSPSLVDHLPGIETFRRIVHDGQSSGAAVMKGFSGDTNVAPYVDDIYAYLQARAYGELGRGRPIGFGE